MNRSCLLLLLIVVGQISTHSQSLDSLDSLIRIALAAPMDSSRVLLLNEVAITLREADSKLALKYAQEAKLLGDSLGFKRGLGKVLSNMGWIYYRKGVLSKAFDLSTQALSINQELGNKKEIAQCLNTIGAINTEQKAYPAAILNFKQAYGFADETDDLATKGRSLNNIAFCFLKLGKFDSAIYYTNRSAKERSIDKSRSAFSQRILGEISFAEGNYKEALRYFLIAMEGANKQNNNFLKASTLFRIGDTYLKMGDANNALRYLQENLFIAKRYDYNKELESTYQILAEVYAFQNNFAQAFEFQRKYTSLHDSLAELKSEEQIAIIQAKYDSKIKNTQIELLTKNSFLKENEIKTQQVWIYFGSGWLLLLLFLVVVLVRTNRKTRTVNRMLADKNMFINEQARQLVDLNSTKDKLFSIIGHDMRSPLASLRGLMDLVGSAAMTQDEFVEMSRKLRKNLDHVHADLENLLSWAQTQQKGLAPTFENILLYDSVKDKITLHNEIAKAKGIEVVNAVDRDIFVHADRNHLGLVLRNLIGNAIKFTHPKGSIKINCSEEENRIKISVTDTGMGMSKDELDKLFNSGSHFSKPGTQNEKGIGLGLFLVKEFVELNNGTIEVKSNQGEGSTFTFFLQRANNL